MRCLCLKVFAAGLTAACLISICPAAASDDNLQTILVPPTDPPQAGQETIFTVLVANRGDATVRTELPNRIICRLKAAGDVVDVPAASVPPRSVETVEIGAGQFLTTKYRLTLPASLLGWVTLQVPAFDGAVVTVEVRAARKTVQPAETEAGTPDPSTLQSFDEITSLYQPYFGNVGAYEPTYFLVGTEPEKSTFQISFKYQFLNSKGPLVQNHPWTAGFHFGYTQTSFWDLKSASKPFEDTSYKPELFFLSPNIDTGWRRLKGLFLQTGLRHESNGRGGVDSRSTNTVYLKPLFVFYREIGKLGLLVAPKMWLYLSNDDETNPDLYRYRGYADLEIKAGMADSLVLRSVLGWAKEGGSVQMDLTYPLHRFLFGNLNLYFQVQYVNALAESLLNYRQRTRALRFGFAIIR